MKFLTVGLALLSPIGVWAQTTIGSFNLPVGGAGLEGAAGAARAPRISVTASPLTLSLPQLTLPKVAVAPKPVVSVTAAPAVAPMAQLQNMTAEMAAPKKDSAHGPDSTGKKFDGAQARKGAEEEAGVDAEVPTMDVAAPQAEIKELWFGNKVRKQLVSGEQAVSINFIRGSGSEWHWGKFQKDDSVRVIVGGRHLFMTRIAGSDIKEIKAVTKADLAGFYDARTIRSKTISALRQKLIADLTAKESMKSGKIATLSSKVSLVRFMNFKDAKSLPENQEEPAPAVGPRVAAQIPASLEKLELYKYLPKAVVLDMRIFPESVPYPLIEDMGKLMKAGVYFILVTDKKSEGPGGLEETLTKGLTNAQRDQISRYKMIAVTEDGNRMSKFNGSFPAAMPSRRFTSAELDLMEFAAFKEGALRVTEKRGDAMTFELLEAASPRGFANDLSAMLANISGPSPIKHSVSLGEHSVTVRPTSLAESLPHVLETLRDYEGLFINPSDMMVISRDAALLKATEGSVQPAAHSETLQGPALADASLAALLGDYRENQPGDLAASASKIGSFLRDKNAGSGGQRYSVPMMMGHVMHSAFNWAAWAYRNTGVFPDAEATAARAVLNWQREEAERDHTLIDEPNQTMAGYMESMIFRMKSMHATVADLMKKYPIMVGTELPNLVVYDRYKKGALAARDVLRLVYDMVLARETPEGLEVVVVDFKTGQTPTMQSLEKDTQVQLYDDVVRNVWKTLPLPYGGTGAVKTVVKTGIVFVEVTAPYQPVLNEWGRIKFEKFLKNVMNRIRKHNNPAPPKDKKGKS